MPFLLPSSVILLASSFALAVIGTPQLRDCLNQVCEFVTGSFAESSSRVFVLPFQLQVGDAVEVTCSHAALTGVRVTFLTTNPELLLVEQRVIVKPNTTDLAYLAVEVFGYDTQFGQMSLNRSYEGCIHESICKLNFFPVQNDNVVKSTFHMTENLLQYFTAIQIDHENEQILRLKVKIKAANHEGRPGPVGYNQELSDYRDRLVADWMKVKKLDYSFPNVTVDQQPIPPVQPPRPCLEFECQPTTTTSTTTTTTPTTTTTTTILTSTTTTTTTTKATKASTTTIPVRTTSTNIPSSGGNGGGNDNASANEDKNGTIDAEGRNTVTQSENDEENVAESCFGCDLGSGRWQVSGGLWVGENANANRFLVLLIGNSFLMAVMLWIVFVLVLRHCLFPPVQAESSRSSGERDDLAQTMAAKPPPPLERASVEPKPVSWVPE